MSRVLVFILLFFVQALASGKQKAHPNLDCKGLGPFCLVLGATTKEEAISVLTKEGGRVKASYYKKLPKDLTNPNIEIVEFEGLPTGIIKDEREVKFEEVQLWFYNGVLYKIYYILSHRLEYRSYSYIEEVANILKLMYGDPSNLDRVENVIPLLVNRKIPVVWVYNNVKIELKLIEGFWISLISLEYTYMPLIDLERASDREVLRKVLPYKNF